VYQLTNERQHTWQLWKKLFELASEITVSSVTFTINSKAINVIFLDEILDPVAILCNNGRVPCVNIRQRNFVVAQPALLFTGCISPLNRTEGVIHGLVTT
jgi:hypothetical protein